MEISIKTVKGKDINLEVDDTSDTIDLKIHGPTRRLVIRLGPDHVSDTGSRPEAVLLIHIETLGGRAFTVKVKETKTIKILKDFIEARDGIPVSQQRLIFEGKNLEDERTLAYYKIKTGSTLVMMLHLCGC